MANVRVLPGGMPYRVFVQGNVPAYQVPAIKTAVADRMSGIIIGKWVVSLARGKDGEGGRRDGGGCYTFRVFSIVPLPFSDPRLLAFHQN